MGGADTEIGIPDGWHCAIRVFLHCHLISLLGCFEWHELGKPGGWDRTGQAWMLKLEANLTLELG